MHEEWRGARRLGTRLDAMADGGGDGHDMLGGLGFGPTAEGTAATAASSATRRHPRASHLPSSGSIREETVREAETGECAYEPFYESIGGTQVDVANMDWDALPETLKNARTSRSKIVVEAVVNELRQLNAKTEALMQEERDKLEEHKSKREKKEIGRKRTRGKDGSDTTRQDSGNDDDDDGDKDDVRFKLTRRKSISLSMDMIDSIAELEYVSNEPPARRRNNNISTSNVSDLDPDLNLGPNPNQNQNQNQGGEVVVPWDALTEEERATRYHTTLCAVSEWNLMMAEAARPVDDYGYFPGGGGHGGATTTAASASGVVRSPYAMTFHTPNTTTQNIPSGGSMTPVSGQSGSAYSVSSAGSGDRHRLDISTTMSASSSPLTSEHSW